MMVFHPWVAFSAQPPGEKVLDNEAKKHMGLGPKQLYTVYWEHP